MTKHQILEVVKQMHKDWKVCKDEYDYSQPLKNKCHKGFCLWLEFNCVNRNFDFIIKELQNDILNIDMAYDNYPYWYDTTSLFFTDKKNLNQLQLRIDHLQRTITRLENEIKQEKK